MNYKILYDELEKANLEKLMTDSQKYYAQAKFEGYSIGLDEAILQFDYEGKYEEANRIRDKYNELLRKRVIESIIPEYREKVLKKIKKEDKFFSKFNKLLRFFRL